MTNARNIITLDNAKSYASEKNLEAALKRLGLDDYRDSETDTPCRYIIARTPEERAEKEAADRADMTKGPLNV